jgi:hypothetical protein
MDVRALQGFCRIVADLAFTDRRSTLATPPEDWQGRNVTPEVGRNWPRRDRVREKTARDA